MATSKNLQKFQKFVAEAALAANANDNEAFQDNSEKVVIYIKRLMAEELDRKGIKYDPETLYAILN